MIEFDAIDRKLLALLQENARASFAELGRQVKLSTPSAIERVRRLEDAGVILAYRAQVDPAALGYRMAAIVRVTVAGERLQKFAQQIGQIPEVLECHRITGAESFLMRVAVRDTAHLETVIDSLLPYVATTTSLILATPVRWRSVAAPEEKPKSAQPRRSAKSATRR